MMFASSVPIYTRGNDLMWDQPHVLHDQHQPSMKREERGERHVSFDSNKSVHTNTDDNTANNDDGDGDGGDVADDALPNIQSEVIVVISWRHSTAQSTPQQQHMPRLLVGVVETVPTIFHSDPTPHQPDEHLQRDAKSTRHQNHVRFMPSMEVLWEPTPQRSKEAEQYRHEGTLFLLDCQHWRRHITVMDSVLGDALLSKKTLGPISCSGDVVHTLKHFHDAGYDSSSSVDDSNTTSRDASFSMPSDDTHATHTTQADDQVVHKSGNSDDSIISGVSDSLDDSTPQVECCVWQEVVYHDCECGLRCPVGNCVFE